MIDFDTIEYLKYGNAKQLLAYNILTETGIMDLLAEFDPLLVGTIPIDIDIETSDLDIVCFYKDKSYYIKKVKTLFSGHRDFTLREKQNFTSVVAAFQAVPFEIELFGQDVPTKQQNAYRHMLVEHQLLLKYGDDFRCKIKDLKRKGYKTEPAFAFVLGLAGDPYEELLKYEHKL
ncbi:DUF4269 domain-containing protein [Dyadobacter psychrotolerans]|uniref:DUF4269 domain-containing protein n=1 Tax=Dyadobacter psychrotolerans TaxID=2541721 RepID=A0A4R5DT97_9BACT|nr:DUF4269 domain-containing protein [Dyadobacter psychrotolerans]TDE17629.1 DUF4269 domain-containing protein [Dyadobacter psychrotolerans]